MTHSFLMIGQSNMAGRGFTAEVPAILDEGIKVLRNGRWQTMTEPVNYDRPVAGVSLAVSFAAALRHSNPQAAVGLIPCADGGSSIDEWAVDGPLFENAVTQARLAMRDSTLAGILWHQGEADSLPGNAERYTSKFGPVIAALRAALNAPAIPLIVGGLGDFLVKGTYGKVFSSYQVVNDQLLQYAESQPHCYFATAAGLTANPDYIHFNAASLRLFGIRYAEAFTKQQQITAPLPFESAVLETIYNREMTVAEKTFELQLKFAHGKISVTTFQQELEQLQPL
ncbi:sialate O-acetylesterase [Chitinophaga sp. Cy-1792]|uniref:sialate O-acetylesterase n=1 Tax=Chitinophaga sp. Cy-1792 TaxID=2608339 RepID=UPI00141FB4B0|nr:sialate O-acetylesterase [Chitinophaga sp. Cy-1792]NIG54431.1 sialate O-acetylesterase [Chitinophaga sp. Cy-1792]